MMLKLFSALTLVYNNGDPLEPPPIRILFVHFEGHFSFLNLSVVFFYFKDSAVFNFSDISEIYS